MSNGGWTLVMRCIADDVPYYDSAWSTTQVVDEQNYDFGQSGWSKYESFNSVPFTELKTSDPSTFTAAYIETFAAGYGSALELFSGPGQSLTLTSLNEGYFLSLIQNGYYNQWGCTQHHAYGINQLDYLGTGFINWGAFCDWNGGARWGLRYNASHGYTGNHMGIGWGNTTTIGISPQPISQLMWVR